MLITKSYCAVVFTTTYSLAISFLSKRLSDANLDLGTCHLLNSQMDEQCGDLTPDLQTRKWTREEEGLAQVSVAQCT